MKAACSDGAMKGNRQTLVAAGAATLDDLIISLTLRQVTGNNATDCFSAE
jgi:hypothetical protein